LSSDAQLVSTQASDAIDLCAQIIAHHSKSFAMASRLLPKSSRQDAVVLYAWCRRVDDAIDEAISGTESDELKRLEAELTSLYSGQPQSDPVLGAFQDVVFRCGIPQHYPRELLAGMEMDVSGTHYVDEKQLGLYCYRVASVVGLMMCHVMGVRTPLAVQQAAHLGLAMQLTNISRDVVEDWGLGRVYLPQSLLAAHDVNLPVQTKEAEFPLSQVQALRSVVGDVLAWADRHYRLAESGISELPWQSAMAIWAARLIYADIGRSLKAQHNDVSAGRAYTHTSRKIILVVVAISKTMVSFPRRWWLWSQGTIGHIRPDQVLTFEDFWGAGVD